MQTLILQVGCKDADNGVDFDTFSENFGTLLNSISEDNRLLIVSSSLPRKSVDLKPYYLTFRFL